MARAAKASDGSRDSERTEGKQELSERKPDARWTLLTGVTGFLGRELLTTLLAKHPQARYILIVGDAINELDASGEEMIRHLARRLQDTGVTMVFSGLKRQVLGIMEKTGLYASIGAQHFFRTEDMAVEAISQWLNDPAFDEKFLPLRVSAGKAGATAPEK